MNIRRQSTLKAPAVTASVALHNGQHTRLAMRPAPIGSGLRFVRLDIQDRNNIVPVRPDLVTGVRNCTTLSNAAGVGVSTIEHLLAALSAAGIDNLDVELDGAELPALDGSSEPFLKLIEQVGVDRQPAPRKYVKILETIEVKSGDMWARIEPCDRLELDVTIDFKEEAIGHQRLEIVPDVRSFRERMYLGGPILGRVTTFKSGHGLNHDLLMKLYGTPTAWKFTTMAMPKSMSEDQARLTSVSA